MKSTFVSKTDLAQAYFPHINAASARNKLMQIINSDSRLMPLLIDAGYKKNNRQFSPACVELIMERLGKPW